MQKHFNQIIYTLLLLVLLLLSCIFLASLTLFFIVKTIFNDISILNGAIVELFARLFVLWLILPFYTAILLSKTVRNQFPTERWFLIMLILFALGAAFAVGDPYHVMLNEYNWIRYWTAGVLGVAGVISVLSSLSSAYRLPDRLFGGFFGLLLVAAAGDELFQFHEHAGLLIDFYWLDYYVSSESKLHGQDLLGLGVAAFGVVAVVMAVLVLRLMPWAKELILDRKYRRTCSLFALAVFIFLAAMMLDTFDWYLEHLADRLLATILGISVANEVPRWLGFSYITVAANSLEELLEYLAALFFLMMIGTLFSIKAMGCDLPTNKKSEKTKSNLLS